MQHAFHPTINSQTRGCVWRSALVFCQLSSHLASTEIVNT